MLGQRLTQVGVCPSADLGKALDRRDQRGLESLHGGAGALEQRFGHALVLADQSEQEMLGLHGLVPGFPRELSSFLQSLQRLFREPFLSHVAIYSMTFWRPNSLSVSWRHA